MTSTIDIDESTKEVHVSTDVSREDGRDDATPNRAAANIRRKRALQSPFTRAVASPGHTAQMQKIFQEAKTSLQRDMAFASSSTGSIASRLPAIEIDQSASREDSPTRGRGAWQGHQPGDWRYSLAPDFLANSDADVREPFPDDDYSPYLPMMPSSDAIDVPTAEAGLFGNSGPTSHEDDDVEMDDLPPLPDSDTIKKLSTSGSFSDSDGDEPLLTASYGIPLARPMQSTELERSMSRMGVSQVDAWLHDILDDSPRPRASDPARRIKPSRMVAPTQPSPIKAPIYLSRTAKAAAESAKRKRGYSGQRTVSNKENDGSNSTPRLLYQPPIRPSRPSRFLLSPPMRLLTSHEPFRSSSPPIRHERRWPAKTSEALCTGGKSNLAPPPIKRVDSSGSPLPIQRFPPTPPPGMGQFNYMTNFESNVGRFRRQPINGISKYYPSLNSPYTRTASRTPSPLQTFAQLRSGLYNMDESESAASDSQGSWADQDQLYSLTGQDTAARSRAPIYDNRPGFLSSPPRPSNHHALPPRRKKQRNRDLMPPSRDGPRYWGSSFEIAEDDDAYNAVNEAEVSPSQVEHSQMVVGNGMVDVDSDDPGPSAEAHGPTQLRPQSWYDGSEQYSDMPYIQPESSTPLKSDQGEHVDIRSQVSELARLSPNVTPFRKGDSSGKKRYGFRVSPIKKRRCPSYYDEDVIPRPASSHRMTADAGGEKDKRRALEEIVAEDTYRVSEDEIAGMEDDRSEYGGSEPMDVQDAFDADADEIHDMKEAEVRGAEEVGRDGGQIEDQGIETIEVDVGATDA